MRVGFCSFVTGVKNGPSTGPSRERTAERQRSIRYVAHWTYCSTVSEESVSQPLLSTQAANERTPAFHENFEALLQNPEFLADGGTLAFGLRHVYPIKDSLEHLYGVLKGSDAVVSRAVRALGFEPVLSLYYEWEPPWSDTLEGVLIDEVIDFSSARFPGGVGDIPNLL